MEVYLYRHVTEWRNGVVRYLLFERTSLSKTIEDIHFLNLLMLIAVCLSTDVFTRLSLCVALAKSVSQFSLLDGSQKQSERH